MESESKIARLCAQLGRVVKRVQLRGTPWWEEKHTLTICDDVYWDCEIGSTGLSLYLRHFQSDSIECVKGPRHNRQRRGSSSMEYRRRNVGIACRYVDRHCVHYTAGVVANERFFINRRKTAIQTVGWRPSPQYPPWMKKLRIHWSVSEREWWKMNELRCCCWLASIYYFIIVYTFFSPISPSLLFSIMYQILTLKWCKDSSTLSADSFAALVGFVRGETLLGLNWIIFRLAIQFLFCFDLKTLFRFLIASLRLVLLFGVKYQTLNQVTLVLAGFPYFPPFYVINGYHYYRILLLAIKSALLDSLRTLGTVSD